MLRELKQMNSNYRDVLLPRHAGQVCRRAYSGVETNLQTLTYLLVQSAAMLPNHG